MLRLITGLSAVVAATSALRVEQPALASGWHTAARTTGQVDFTVAIKQQGMEELKRVALAVSTPGDAAYGKHLTSAQVDAITAPSAEDVTAVTEWLQAFNVK
jgi:tripeptidyl-peptidase-1